MSKQGKGKNGGGVIKTPDAEQTMPTTSIENNGVQATETIAPTATVVETQIETGPMTTLEPEIGKIAGETIHPQAPPRPSLSTEELVDASFRRLSIDELRDREELTKINEEQGKLLSIIQSLGLPVPNTPVSVAVAAPVEAEVPRVAGTRGRKKGATSSLWDILSNHMFRGGFITPNFANAKDLIEVGTKAGFAATATMLSIKTKEGSLVRGDRGQYALPKKFKPKT